MTCMVLQKHTAGENPQGLLACHMEKNRDGLLGMIGYEADMSTFTIKERIK